MGDLLRDRVMREHRYEALTWPEVNEAVALKKAVLLPVGATEQHGHHLPLATDTNQVTTICLEAGRRSPDDILVLPAVSYGYNHHVMDFPGTINIEPSTFARFLIDIGRSVGSALANRTADAFLMKLRNAVKSFAATTNAQRCPTMPQPADPITLDENACETADHTVNSCAPSTRVMILVTIAGSFIASADDIDAAHTIFAQALRRNLPSTGH